MQVSDLALFMGTVPLVHPSDVLTDEPIRYTSMLDGQAQPFAVIWVETDDSKWTNWALWPTGWCRASVDFPKEL